MHYHKVGFQLIFCVAGWVDVLYEDQGEKIRLHAGDCFIQPPEIRHRVLYASEAIEVLEIGVPAEHITEIDHEMELPTPHLRPDREWQRTSYAYGRDRELGHFRLLPAPVGMREDRSRRAQFSTFRENQVGPFGRWKR